MQIVAVVAGVAIVMFVVELFARGRVWKKVTGWWGRAALLNGVQVAAVFVSGVTWDRWFDGWALFRLEDYLGFGGGAVAGYVVITFIYYWWHRWRHEVPFLWRVFHQVHHSPQRIELITSFYKHPAEIFANSILSSAIVYILCGLSPAAASLSVLLTGLGELFYHWNVNTPRWIGFIFQRPESHCIHHKMRWHRQNFSDLPIWDMAFGTFHNPYRFESQCGFEKDYELRLVEMLKGTDLHQSAVAEGGGGT